jgi:hypothetical protein
MRYSVFKEFTGYPDKTQILIKRLSIDLRLNVYRICAEYLHRKAYSFTNQLRSDPAAPLNGNDSAYCDIFPCIAFVDNAQVSLHAFCIPEIHMQRVLIEVISLHVRALLFHNKN